jgi:NADH-quinone oxidoreductase subunit A
MLFQFANVLIFIFFALFLCGLMLGLGALLRPSNPQPYKLTTYECGEPPSGPAWINFNIRFYLIALVFVIFDVELAFVYPVAAVYKQWIADGRTALILTELVLFVGILFVGLVYVWVKGDLEWLKQVRAEREAAATPADVRRAA